MCVPARRRFGEGLLFKNIHFTIRAVLWLMVVVGMSCGR
jgi:hypothetical protein